MSTTLRRRVERMERIAKSVRPDSGLVVAILLAARRRAAARSQGHQLVDPSSAECLEELRRHVRELRQRRDAHLRIQRAMNSARR